MAGGHDEHGSGGAITDKMIVRDIIQACPQAREVLVKHLGESALKMPGSLTESLEFLAAMNDYHAYIILEELNQVCKVAPGKVGHF